MLLVLALFMLLICLPPPPPYPTLPQVHEVEKSHACTVTPHQIGGGATLCVEVADWRARRALRLKFRVAPSFACCVGGPRVEVREEGRGIC